MRDEWQLEMDRLLDLFEHESESSLRKINRRLEVLDCPFNEEFRQYFMKRSTQRLDVSFTKIEMERWGNRQIRNGERANHGNTKDCSIFASGSNTTVNAHSSTDEAINLIVKSENVIEITDSDDEDDSIQPDEPMEMQRGNSVQQNPNGRIASIGGRNARTYSELIKISPFIMNDEGSNDVAIAEDSNGQEDQTIESDGDEYMLRSGEMSKSNESIKVENNTSLASEFMDEEESIPLVTFDPNEGTGQSTAKNGDFNRRPGSSKTAANNRSECVGGKRYKCDHCDSSFRDNRDLRRHQPVHANGKLIGLKADANGLYHCNRCVRQFKNINHLSMHMTSHKDGRYLHDCARCLRQFEQEADKDKHESQCEGYHYECHLCKAFVTTFESHMKMHMRKHSGAKPFGCMVCNMSFSQKGNLRRHLNSFHSRTNK